MDPHRIGHPSHAPWPSSPNAGEVPGAVAPQPASAPLRRDAQGPGLSLPPLRAVLSSLRDGPEPSSVLLPPIDALPSSPRPALAPRADLALLRARPAGPAAIAAGRPPSGPSRPTQLLDPQQRDAIVEMKHFRDMSNAQIAEATGISRTTVDYNLRRAEAERLAQQTPAPAQGVPPETIREIVALWGGQGLEASAISSRLGIDRATVAAVIETEVSVRRLTTLNDRDACNRYGDATNAAVDRLIALQPPLGSSEIGRRIGVENGRAVRRLISAAEQRAGQRAPVSGSGRTGG